MQLFKSEIPQWVHVGTSLDGEKFEIQGVDVWRHAWKDEEGQAVVKDPIYGQTFRFGVYRVQTDGKIVEFAAGEFSNCVWGFYVRNANAA